MFKGTEKFKGKDFDRMVQANGGDNNAFTSRDYTGYYMNLPSNKLELVIDIESDRMRNLLFDEKEIASEREVVKEERRYRVENSPYGILDEATYTTVFKVHPYRWPVVGYMKDLNAASMDDLKEFYRIFYAPNNAVVVIAGDVSASQVKKLVTKYFGKIQAQPLPDKNFAEEPPQKGERNVNLTRDLQSPIFGVAYQAPKAGDADAYAMDLISNILSYGPSSRLYRRLVYREQVATDVSAWSYTPANKGIFEVTATIKNGASMDKAITSVFAEMFKLRQAKVSEEELQKAKNQVIFGYISGLKTVAGKASALALNEILFGDYTMLFSDVKKYMDVTPEQIQKVAEDYFGPAQRSLIKIQPAQKQAAGTGA
jgi:zinc protease